MSETSDLTSLSWLHNLNIMDNLSVTTAPPTPPASPLPGDVRKDAAGKVNGGTGVKRSGPTSVASLKEEEKEIDYKVVGDVKPPYSYASLICMAMKTNKHKMTLSSIYKWIKENFLYYRNADPSWQVNSTVHFFFFYNYVVYCNWMLQRDENSNRGWPQPINRMILG